MLQVRRAVLRPRLRRSRIAAWLALAVVAAGIAGGVLLVPPVRRAQPIELTVGRSADDRATAALLREEIRQISLAACEARVEVDRMLLRKECEAGTASRFACGRDEGQFRVDPCRRYRPPSELDGCPFPGSC
jgi:hypothetical protein